MSVPPAASGLALRAESARFLAWHRLADTAARRMAEAIGDWHEIEMTDPIAQALAANLPFYPGCQLVALRFAGWTHDVFAFARDGALLEHGVLDGTNRAIYAQNAAVPILLTPDTAALYARVFFHFVHGAVSRFTIADGVANIPWLPDAPEAIRTEITNLLLPLTFLGADADGCYRLTGTVLFRNALFRSAIVIAARATTRQVQNEQVFLNIGEIALEDEILLGDNLPVIAPEAE